jgi:uncharacterized protein (TIGR00297 family)
VSLALALALAGGLALAGWLLDWLSPRGALAATAVGLAVLGGRGIQGALLLAVFFVSGSLLSKLSASATSTGKARNPRRKARQVLANGAWAAVAALIPATSGGWVLFGGALAAAQADTWATETGAFSRPEPRMLTTGKTVPHGTSGGVTTLGTLGGILGALLMGALAGWASGSAAVGVATAAGGTAGMMADSLLGAAAQAVYYCEHCDLTTEDRRHDCGESSRRLRGWGMLDNDGVNFAATGMGAAVAMAAWLIP